MTRGARDVVVVGGGPGGAAAAARLARAGHAVLVLDRADFPRRKPCGECVNPAGVAALDRLGVLDAVRAAGAVPVPGWRIDAGGGEGFSGSYPPEMPGLALPRERLDAILLDHARAAGAEVRTGVRVVDVLRDGSGAVVGVRTDAASTEEDAPGASFAASTEIVPAERTPSPALPRERGRERSRREAAGVASVEGDEVRARLVVGADGLRSVVVRRLGLVRRAPRLLKLALTAHLRGVAGVDGRGELRVGEDGCVGVARVGAELWNVTVVVAGEARAEVGGDAEGFFDRAVERAGVVGERVDDVLATGPFDWPVRRAAAAGVLLVGDAAGYYDPFTGQGIFRALLGAESAAATADAALRAGDLSAAALSAHDRALRRALAPGRRLQRLVEAFVSRPPLLRLAARRLSRRSALADALIRATGDVAPVRSLLDPRLLSTDASTR